MAASLAVVLRVWLEVVGPLPGERWALQQYPLWPQRQGVVGEVVLFFDLLGRPLFAAAGLAITVWLIGRGGDRRAVVFVVAATAGVAVNAVLKVVSGRTPLWAEAHPEISGLNYPSGHTVHVVVFAGALAVLAHRCGRRDLVALAVVPIVLAGPSRVLSGAHLISDVIAGYLIGAAWLALVVALVGRFTTTDGDRRRCRTSAV